MERTYTEEFNGFVGVGKTPRQAKIACAYACAYLSFQLETAQRRATFGSLGAWNGQEEECYAALVGKPVSSAA